MRASVFVGVSVDGFLARPDDALDFLPPGGGEAHGYDEFIATVDVLVIGRRTYEKVLTFDGWPYGAKPVVVLSSRPPAPSPAGARVEGMGGDPADILARLSVLIGQGIPLFGPLDRDVPLRHVATRTYASGLVTSEYDVVG